MKYLTTQLSASVHPQGDNPLFGEGATHIRIDDEGAGGFIVLEQSTEAHGEQRLRLDLDELKLIVQTAQELYAKFERNSNARTTPGMD